MVEKTAKARQRAPRKDQSQEAILQLKDEVNARTSRLIELLKKTKSGLNGGPAPDIGVEKFKLTDPMPDGVIQSGRTALQELSSILEGIQRVDQMQNDYAAERESRLAERMKKMQEMHQEAAFDIRIKKEASNKLTRLWSNIVAPFSSEKGKTERLSMLNALGRIDANLQEVEDKVLSKDPSILDALLFSKNLYADAKITFFTPFRENLKEMLDVSTKASEDLQQAVKEEEKKIETKKKALEKEKAQRERDEFKSKMTETKPTTPIEKQKSNIDKKMTEMVVPEKQKEPKSEKPKTEKTEKKIEPKLEEPKVEEPESLGPSFLREKKPFVKEVVTPNIESKRTILPDIPIPPESPVEIPESIEEALPEISLEERSTVYRKHLVDNIQQLYRDVFKSVSELNNIPDPWDDRIRNQWSGLNAQADYVMRLIISAIPEGFDVRKYIEKQHIQYLMFIKMIGDIQASINAYKSELVLSKDNEEFEFGSTIDEKNLQDQALNFTENYRKELQSMAEISHALVSLATNKFTRMLKRLRTQMSFGKIDRSLRLEVDKDLRSARENLQGMMDNLERKNINFRVLISDSLRFYDSLIDVYSGLASLGGMYNSRMLMEKAKRKTEKQYMPYDILRETDVRAMKGIADELKRDRDNIRQLYSVEGMIPDLETQLSRLKREYDGLN